MQIILAIAISVLLILALIGSIPFKGDNTEQFNSPNDSNE